MKKPYTYSILLLSSFISFCGCSDYDEHLYDERLQGSWEINKEATIERFERENPAAKEKLGENLEFYYSLLENSTLVIKGNKVTSIFGEETFEALYKLIERGDDFVIISSHHELVSSGDGEASEPNESGDGGRTKITFVEDGFWIDDLDVGSSEMTIHRKFEKTK